MKWSFQDQSIRLKLIDTKCQNQVLAIKSQRFILLGSIITALVGCSLSLDLSTPLFYENQQDFGGIPFSDMSNQSLRNQDAGEVHMGEYNMDTGVARDFMAGIEGGGDMADTINAGSNLAGETAGTTAGSDLAGETAGSIAGTTAGEDTPLYDPPFTRLPYSECLTYDIHEERCLTPLIRSGDEICLDWNENYQMIEPKPWNGDRNSCELGEYKAVGLEDFTRLLNLYRRQSRLNEIMTSSPEILRHCALAQDVLQRDGVTDLSETNCNTPDNIAGINEPHFTVQGPWSLYAQLHSLISLATFGGPITDLLEFRFTALRPDLVNVKVGGRGRTMCFQAVLNEAPISQALVFSYPPVGVNPYAMVKDANYRGRRLPWSITIAQSEVNDLNISISVIGEEDTREVVESQVSSIRTLGNYSLFALSLLQPPQAQTLYEIDLSWNHYNTQHRVKLWYLFKDCGLHQPSECQVFPEDNCILTGTRCALLPSGNDSFAKRCLWQGPLETGMPCEGLGTISCTRGICAAITAEGTLCHDLCDTLVDPEFPFSCSQCLRGSSEDLIDSSLEICQ